MSGRFGRVLAALLVLVSFAPATRAQDHVPGDLTVVGKFYAPDGHSVLYVVTDKVAGDKQTKGAAVGVEFENSGSNFVYNGTYTHLITTFLSAGEWRKFVELWNKARAEAAHGTETDGFYFDGETEMEVSSSRRGEVDFTLAGNGQVDNHPKDMTFFFMKPKDFPEFDREVKQVSTYFEK